MLVISRVFRPAVQASHLCFSYRENDEINTKLIRHSFREEIGFKSDVWDVAQS